MAKAARFFLARAPRPILRLAAGDPVVGAIRGVPHPGRVNDHLEELRMRVADGELAPSSAATYARVAPRVAEAIAEVDPFWDRLGRADVQAILRHADRNPEGGVAGLATRRKIRVFVGGMVRAAAGSPTAQSHYLALVFQLGRGEPLPGLAALPRHRGSTVPTPTDPEMTALYRAASTEQEKIVLGLLYVAGGRRGDVVAARLGDVLDLAAQLARGERPQLLFRRGKGGRDRSVSLEPEDAIDFLAAARRRAAELPPGSPRDVPLLAGRGGGLSPSTVNRVVDRLCRRAGVRHFTPQAFRRKHFDDWEAQYAPATLAKRQILAARMGHGVAMRPHYAAEERAA
jgi:integrase